MALNLIKGKKVPALDAILTYTLLRLDRCGTMFEQRSGRLGSHAL